MTANQVLVLIRKVMMLVGLKGIAPLAPIVAIVFIIDRIEAGIGKAH